MRYAQPVRRELRMRTVFNLLGPLANPARAQVQLIGAPSPGAAQIMAEALARLGTRHSFIVHGHDGLDEISTTAPTDVWDVCSGRVAKYVWTPEQFGVRRASLDELKGADAARNAQIAQEVLDGAPGAARDIVLVNAAAGLIAGGFANDLTTGMKAAAHSIDSGAARERLAQLRQKFPAE